MIQFEFATASRIVFEAGAIQKAGALAAEMGWRALVVAGLSLERVQPLLNQLAAAKIVSTLYMVAQEPDVQTVREGVELARRNSCDLVIGFGGGSAIDAGKAIAALVSNTGDLLDYLEVIGKGLPLQQPPLPYIAIPTTAGTGSEVTRNAVIGVPERRVKVSMRSPLMLPRLALIDPELCYSLPPAITASTGMDALTQLIEPFICNQPNPLTDAITREGMRYAARSLRRAYTNGSDIEARQQMSLASLFGGLALANARLGAVHGFAAVLGGMYAAPHGAICARLLPLVVEINVSAMKQREPYHPALSRYLEVARILTERPQAKIEDGISWLHELCSALEIPPLSIYGVEPAEIPAICEKSSHASSMRGNPIQLTVEEMEEILTRAF
ncbi:MAG: iron-containing alcohol dehydrogenase [Anaerolineales bacterium]|nr:iron-containing alcohol dehydrogenase [Anaerolineales bacterium]